MKVSTLMTAVLAFAVLHTAHAAEQDEYNIYLTARDSYNIPLKEPTTQFGCKDKIYGVIEINRAKGNTEHVLHATWRNPSGEDQEVTEYPFNLINGSARIWVWLKLHRSAESALTQFLNPSGGLEEFAGEWELRIRIDDEEIARKKFEVFC